MEISRALLFPGLAGFADTLQTNRRWHCVVGHTSPAYDDRADGRIWEIRENAFRRSSISPPGVLRDVTLAVLLDCSIGKRKQPGHQREPDFKNLLSTPGCAGQQHHNQLC